MEDDQFKDTGTGTASETSLTRLGLTRSNGRGHLLNKAVGAKEEREKRIDVEKKKNSEF